MLQPRVPGGARHQDRVEALLDRVPGREGGGEGGGQVTGSALGGTDIKQNPFSAVFFF